MSQKIGHEHQESWGISPLSMPAGRISNQATRLQGKILLGGFAGVFMGLILSFLVDPTAHADLSAASQNDNYLTGSQLITENVDALPNRHQIVLDAQLSDDYRYRIPAWQKPERKNVVLSVVATAYNNVPSQTDDTPDIAAWGDRIKPGMPLIAVSRDLLKMGLKRGMKVQVSGLNGEFIVLDKMNKRYKKRIDIYMGKNIKAARNFGKKRVMLSWAKNQEKFIPTIVASR